MRSLEYRSNTWGDETERSPDPETQTGVNEEYSRRLDSIRTRVLDYPGAENQPAGQANFETERMPIGEIDGRPFSLYFFVYSPDETESKHLPYSPSVMAVYPFEAIDKLPPVVLDRIYISRKHFDSRNSRYDEPKVLEEFERLEIAIVQYEAALAAKEKDTTS